MAIHEANYGWIITKDVINAGTYENTELGVNGPRNPYPKEMADPASVIRFRLYDDDNELYFEGELWGSYSEFEPLDDFGTPAYGCTRIDTFNPERNTWETV